MQTQSKFNEIYRDEINKVGRDIKKQIEKIQKIPKYNANLCKYAKYAAYFKGLTLRARGKGETFENCEYYDVNSMYPAMWSPEYIYPSGDSRVYKLDGVYGKSWEEVKPLLKNRCAFVLVSYDPETIKQKYNLEYAQAFIGSLQDYKFDNGIVEETTRSVVERETNNGRYTIFLDNAHMDCFFKLYDLEYYIVTVEVFEKTFSWDPRVLEVFENFKQKANSLKQTDELAAKIIKNAINKTAYGKIVQRNYKMSCATKKEQVDKSFVMGLWITGYAMQKELDNILAHINSFRYCDTDSIVLQDDNLEQDKVHPTKLGFYKHEYTGVTIDIYGFKFYTIRKQKQILKETNLVKELAVDTNITQRINSILKTKAKQNRRKANQIDLDEFLIWDDVPDPMDTFSD